MEFLDINNTDLYLASDLTAANVLQIPEPEGGGSEASPLAARTDTAIIRTTSSFIHPLLHRNCHSIRYTPSISIRDIYTIQASDMYSSTSISSQTTPLPSLSYITTNQLTILGIYRPQNTSSLRPLPRPRTGTISRIPRLCNRTQSHHGLELSLSLEPEQGREYHATQTPKTTDRKRHPDNRMLGLDGFHGKCALCVFDHCVCGVYTVNQDGAITP